MRLEVALLSIPFAFCLSLFAFRASIATRSSKVVSLSLRTIAYPFSSVSPRFPSSCLYYSQKSRDFSNVRLSRRFKTCINEKQSIFQQKISTLKNALKNTKSPWKSRTFVCCSLFVLHRWRRHPESDRGIKVLQTSALPLGYGAE